MSKEYIERDSLIAWVANNVKILNYARYIISVLSDKERFPAADVAPVVHGEWVVVAKGLLGKNYACSKCYVLASEGNSGHNDILTPFCPYCGACMDRGENNA